MILRDGALKAFLYDAKDPNSGAGDHGFYGKSMDESEAWEAQQGDKFDKFMDFFYRHHCDTWIVFELQYRATKKLVRTADEEVNGVTKGTCARFKNGNNADRWCYHPEDAALVAMWIGPHREEKQMREDAKLNLQLNAEQTGGKKGKAALLPGRKGRDSGAAEAGEPRSR